MTIDKSTWIRIIFGALIIASSIIILKIIFGQIFELIPIAIGIAIPALLIRTNDIIDVLTIGLMMGILGGLILSVFYLTILVGFTLFLIIFCIVGVFISYCLFGRSSVK